MTAVERYAVVTCIAPFDELELLALILHAFRNIHFLGTFFLLRQTLLRQTAARSFESPGLHAPMQNLETCVTTLIQPRRIRYP